jgi:SAM-dependent methyltransferase|tara:strand:+ start:1186 stop:1887 length:702 start_codon:yes stop_codon:yes gene_type:complete
MKKSDNQMQEWDSAYQNKDNFVFYPHEEIIRFVSKFIKKRTGRNEFINVHDAEDIKVFDLGCGIGRHVIFCQDMKLDAYGLDLSGKAIEYARDWLSSQGVRDVNKKLQHGDARNLPWDNCFFDFALSHGVLDSMPFEIAKEVIKDLHRAMKPGGLFYCDLISGDDSEHAREFSGEELVATAHEEGTIQSFFNMEKINNLLGVFFEVEECQLIKHQNVLSGRYHARYCLIARRV